MHRRFACFGGALWLLLFTSTPVSADPRAPLPPWPQESLSTFGWDEGYWYVPQAQRAVGAENALVAESWSGYSLVREKGQLQPVAIPTLKSEESRFSERNLSLETGAVRFWFRPDWSSGVGRGRRAIEGGPGYAARLVELVDLNSTFPDVRWSLSLNEAGNELRLNGRGSRFGGELLSAPVMFEAGEWRLITVGYGAEGTQLWVDHQRVAEGPGVTPAPDWLEPVTGLIIGSAVDGSLGAGGEFEELTTFDYWPDAKQQEFYYSGMMRSVLKGTVGTPEEEAFKEENLTVMMQSSGVPAPPGSGGGGGGGGSISNPPAYNYAPGTFYVEILSATNGQATVELHNTVPDLMYELLSVTELTNGPWAGESPFVIGASGQTSTVAAVSILDRTNSLFLQARSWVDTDGDGLVDWWELENGLDPELADTGNTGISDGYKDADGDGWHNLEEFENNTSPTAFNTPPTPTGMMASYLSASQVHVAWNPSPGAVTGYSVESGWNGIWQTNSVGSTTVATSHTLNPAPGTNTPPFVEPTYRVRAHYAVGSSEWTEPFFPSDHLPELDARVVSGPGGRHVLVVSGMGNEISEIRLTLARRDGFFDPIEYTTHTIPATNFVGGRFEIPDAWEPLLTNENSYNNWYLQPVHDSGLTGGSTSIGWNPGLPFIDGREQLRQNLSFKLHAANWIDPFFYSEKWTNSSGNYVYRKIEYPEPLDMGRAYADFSRPYGSSFGNAIAEFWPFEANYVYRNFVFDPAHLDAWGYLTTGSHGEHNLGSTLLLPGTFEFTRPTTTNAIPAVLPRIESRWTDGFYDKLHFGVGFSGGNWTMATGYLNYFSLPYVSAKVVQYSGTTQIAETLVAGGTLPIRSGPVVFYPEAAEPQLQTVDYYFGRRYYHPMPAHLAFSNTITSPLIVTGVGEQNFTVGGFAKQAILNGDPTMFAYLAQYFDKAYRMDSSGTVTTNETGILSPYGQFFATEPGPVALVTMPDLTISQQRGTGVVHAIKLQLDVNHDGVMDPTFAGPDNPSTDRPFRFWINNDHDGWGTGKEIDSGGDYLDGVIQSQRDLEDFARLWFMGLPELPASEGYSVTLEMIPYYGTTPAIKLYPAWESNGGIGYLTNSTTAVPQMAVQIGQISPGQTLGEIAEDSPLEFPANYFAAGGNKHFLFEGSGKGTGELVMKLFKDSEQIARTSTWLELNHIKDMYEMALATNVTTGLPPSSMISQLSGVRSTTPHHDETPQVIVFVHGINNTEHDFRSSTETMFKRLYWSGYRGKVAGFRWPCAYLPFENTYNPFNYNKGEFYAFKSASAFKDYLEHLANREDMTGYSINILAHSQGNIVAGEAIRQGAPFDTYIISQGAVAAGSYDGSAPNLQKLIDADTSTPTPQLAGFGGYRQMFAIMPGNVVNFYNPQDFALATGTVGSTEANWERNQETQKPESFSIGLHYSYNAQSSVSYRRFLDSNFIPLTDDHEIRSMVARSLTRAVGTEINLSGAIDSSVSLMTQFDFGNTRSEHSAQFARRIHGVWPYYNRIMIELGLQPALQP